MKLLLQCWFKRYPIDFRDIKIKQMTTNLINVLPAQKSERLKKKLEGIPDFIHSVRYQQFGSGVAFDSLFSQSVNSLVIIRSFPRIFWLFLLIFLQKADEFYQLRHEIVCFHSAERFFGLFLGE